MCNCMLKLEIPGVNVERFFLKKMLNSRPLVKCIRRNNETEIFEGQIVWAVGCYFLKGVTSRGRKSSIMKIEKN